MRSAEILIRTLQSLGTKYLFSLSGNQIMPVYDAWVDSAIELLHVRHEAAAVHMADAWGRLTGEPGVALLTAGPGHANAISAMYVALMAESPVVVLSGHAPIGKLGHSPFQEMPQVEMAAPVTKASWLVRDPDQTGDEIGKAFRLARSGRPGPVHLSLPADVLVAEVTEDGIAASESAAAGAAPPVRAGLAENLVKAIGAAERPLILAGPALMRSDAFRKNAPTLTEVGLPLVGMESPRGVFDPALGAFSEMLAEADLLVLLGKKLDFTLRLGQAPFVNPRARIIQVDPELSVLALTERNARDRLPLLDLAQSDPGHALDTIARGFRNGSPSPQWAEEVARAMSFRPPHWNDLRSREDEALHAVEVGQAVDAFLRGSSESVFVSDGGEFGQWMQACVSAPRRVINGPSGAIGSAVPFALAARLAFPSSRIVTCSGDGAFGFHPFEFDTAVRCRLPFIAVIGNDARWNAEYQIQLRDYGEDRAKGCNLLPNPYHEVARALGAWGRQVKRSSDLPAALSTADESGLPACIDVPIRGEEAPRVERTAPISM